LPHTAAMRGGRSLRFDCAEHAGRPRSSEHAHATLRAQLDVLVKRLRNRRGQDRHAGESRQRRCRRGFLDANKFAHVVHDPVDEVIEPERNWLDDAGIKYIATELLSAPASITPNVPEAEISQG